MGETIGYHSGYMALLTVLYERGHSRPIRSPAGWRESLMAVPVALH